MVQLAEFEASEHRQDRLSERSRPQKSGGRTRREFPILGVVLAPHKRERQRLPGVHVGAPCYLASREFEHPCILGIEPPTMTAA